ncbi:DNA-binding protein [Streptococcus cristatus]|uniref:DNA-binding protein n=1 Tax=Streptococcus TaxID=1301 RepID=UPI001C82C35A|nr:MULTISPECIES: DNA-binding protein [Streptococcus]MBX5325033.1 DNA-binding protein [Streptococcus cristatus]MCY7089005.1 DNA-binding protein [Streptococcus oralis]
MEELIQAIASQIKFTVLQSANIEESFPLELKRKDVAKMLGVSVDTFDDRFRYQKGFPNINDKRWPRDAVREWYNSMLLSSNRIIVFVLSRFK